MLVDLNIAGLPKRTETHKEISAMQRLKRPSERVMPRRRIEPLGRHRDGQQQPSDDGQQQRPGQGFSRYV